MATFVGLLVMNNYDLNQEYADAKTKVAELILEAHKESQSIQTTTRLAELEKALLEVYKVVAEMVDTAWDYSGCTDY